MRGGGGRGVGPRRERDAESRGRSRGQGDGCLRRERRSPAFQVYHYPFNTELDLESWKPGNAAYIYYYSDASSQVYDKTAQEDRKPARCETIENFSESDAPIREESATR